MSARILFSVGDASGDLHGAALAKSLLGRQPDLELFGLGGPGMEAAGVEIVAAGSALAIGGLVEVTRSLRGLHAAWKALLETARSRRPDLVVLVDSGGFNLPLARAIRRVCDAEILYFVAPQVWAWRRGRLRKLARRVDRVAVILPFEVAHYDRAGVRVDFVGHPLVDAFAPEASGAPAALGATGAFGDEAQVRRAARETLGLPQDARVVAILPGSRRNEVEAHLPVQLQALARLVAARPGVRGVIARAPSIEPTAVEAVLARCGGARAEVAVEGGDSRRVLEAADVVLAKPGTGTTEAMLLGRPMVVVARAHPITATLVRRLLRVPHLAMPNLVAGRRIVPEFWQEEADPDAIARALNDLLDGAGRETQRAALARAAAGLGSPGAIDRTASLVFEMLAERAAERRAVPRHESRSRAHVGA